jgi:hypothetical protein
MAQNGKLKLELIDVYSKRLQENVDIALSNTKISESRFFKSTDASKFIQISDLHTGGEGTYKASIDPPSYHRVTRFLKTIKPGGITEDQVLFPVDASKVVSVNFPKFTSLSKEMRTLLSNSSNVSGFQNKTGQELYDAIGVDNIKTAGLLNIACKTLATVYTNDTNVLSLVKELRVLRGDRFFAFVEAGLRDETINSVHSGLFDKAPGVLHTLPQEFSGFEPAGSFKTNDHYGNLQLTFFRKGDEFVADIDIDDANGIEHLFQVLHNHFTGQPTHPYNIHEILIAHQHLDPKYTFNL